ncbi:MAG TPA: iron-siderophore ABC transporter substrate-binding protein, partial [Elainellaceae cyanobacterium]
QDNQAAQSALEKLTSDPLWLQLSAVKQGRVYNVGDYIQGGGPITANLILDDLFRYLLPTKL